MDGQRHAECLHELIDSIAAIELDAIAIEFNSDTVTYKELVTKAGRLAKHLHSLGAGPDVLVGVCVERSIDLIIALLAVLKSGAAYIPLDPHYPQERIRTILSDAQATVFITSAHLNGPDLPPDCSTVLLDKDIPLTEEEYSCPDVCPENLAYVIYTSGSTGKPKGVQITHAGAVNFLRSMQQTPGLSRRDIVLAATTVSFDISVLEIFLPLITGARMHLIDQATAVDGQKLIPHVTAVSVMQATPATWRMLIAAGWEGNPGLTVLCGGEAMPRDLARQLKERCTALWNMYGPTETTVWSSLYRVPDDTAGLPEKVPIGKAIANTALYIVDETGSEVPAGQSGELHIGGNGLARGYLNREELTAQRFVQTSYGRLYKTGDLARRREDGELEYLGRTDHQVKVRGFRIELGEIEAVLMNHDAVQAAAVLVREDTAGDKSLAAHLVPSGKVTPGALRAHLGALLPEYMIPNNFVFLATMPLTPNGKIDRQALAATTADFARDNEAFVTPRTPTEQRLTALWEKTLERAPIGVHDNFIESGGHSLSATRLIARYVDEFGKDMSFQDFFDAPTIALQGKLLDGGTPNERTPPPPLEPRVPAEKCVLSFAQQRLWYADQLAGADETFNMVEAVRLSGPLDVAALRNALEQIVQRHEILRTSFTQSDGVPYQTIHAQRSADWHEVDLRQVPAAEHTERINEIAVTEAHHRFDLQRDPLLRVILIRTAEREHVLLTNMQHIISDDWSMGILYEEWSAAYAAQSGHEHTVPAPLPVQYADYARWQQQWLTDAVVEERMAYWRRQLKGVPSSIDLVPDRKRTGTRTAHGAHESFLIDTELRRHLEDLSARHGVTLFMTLWTAFAILLTRRSRQEDIVIATTMANRHHAQLEPLIGFFINTMPLRVQLTQDLVLSDMLGRVRRIALEAYHDQDLPLDKIIEKLHLSRGDLEVLPLSQVAFNFQNGPAAEPEFPGIKSECLPLETKIAGTELALLMRESREGLRAEFEYSTDLFEAKTIRDMGQQWQRILQAMVAANDASLADICIAAGLTAADGDRSGQDVYFHSYLKQTNLTGNQLLVWIGQQINPDDPIYNSVITYTLPEAVDPDHFRTAFQKVVDCRDSLRTSIKVDNGIPRQEVLAEAEAVVIYEDFSDQPDPDAAVREWISRRARTPFELSGRLYCCALLKSAEERYTWCMAQHHIITDGWSQALIYHDLSEFYREVAGDGPQVDGRRVAFQDYVGHERQLRQSPRYAKAKAYWEEELAREPEPLRFYGQRVQKESTRVERLSLNLGTDLTAAVIAAARAASPGSKSVEAAKFNVFLTLYALFIAHISGQREFRVGIPLHNRRSPEFKGVTGLVMQVVPVTIRIEEDDSLQTLLQRTGRCVLRAMQHGHYVMRNPDNKPLYDVVLNYHMWKGPNFHRRPVGVEWVHPGHAQESLSLQVHDFEQEMEGKAGDLHIDLDFHADVFSAQQQRIALGQFTHLIKLYSRNTACPLREISLLTDEDRTMLLDQVNATGRELPDVCLHHLIEEQARCRPQAVAVEDGAGELTYAELDRQANRLAHFLLQRGAGPERPVGILVERSIQMIVGLLAILKTGSCYVPLDPKSPPERLQTIIDEALTRPDHDPLMLTQASLADRLPAGEGTILLDQEDGVRHTLTESAPPRQAGPGNLAYIIFTSGSTGTPKGVMIEHRSIVNYTRHSVRQYRITPSDKVLQFSSITFDAAGEEIYPILSAGGTLVLRDEETIRTPAAFIEKCNRHRVTLLSMPTTYFHQLTAAAGPDAPRFGDHLRMILFGGERIFPQEVRRWQEVYPRSPELVNTYGPTEATVVATTYFLPPAGSAAAADNEIPIGKPVDNAQIFVLNSHRQPVGLGIPGELCIGGTGVARGYLNRPELTADRFIPHPLRTDTQEKIYRTGDLVRMLPDGNLEFCGRADDQVKLRGYRIELGEIESVLKDHPAVADCAVLVIPGEGPDRKLAAYFTVQSAADQSLDDPRAFLKERLPEYMIPAQFYRLEEFPVTSQGKLDRRALPKIAADAVGPVRVYAPPQTPEEKTLAGIWEEILGIERVGRDDDFFDLGGHSLLATQIISRIQQLFRVELTLRTLFHEPTVRGLAQAIVREKQKAPTGPAISRISRDKHRVQLNEQGDLVEVKK